MWEWSTDADTWIAASTFLLFVVTTALAVFTFLLWRSTGKLATDAKKTATRQADQTQKALEHAENTAKRQLRAYVFVDKAQTRLQTTDGICKFEVQIRNCGQTPAHKVSSWLDITSREFPLQGELPVQPTFPVESRPPIGPNTSHFLEQETKGPISEKQMAAIYSGSKAIYVYGEVKYEDVFGERYTLKIRCVCVFDDLQHKRLRSYGDGNKEIKGWG